MVIKMTIEKKIIPYEILFRLTQAGEVQGCHLRNLEIVADSQSGEVYAVKELDPEPVAGAAMDSVLGVINTALTTTIAGLNSEVFALRVEVAELEQAGVSTSEAMVELQSVNLLLSGQLSDSNEIINQLNAQLLVLQQDSNNLSSVQAEVVDAGAE